MKAQGFQTHTDRRLRRWCSSAVVAGSSVYLYLSLFTLRGTPFLLGGDQVFYWMDAEHMLAGGRIYRDFFKFTPPGTDLVYFAAFKMLGLHIWVPNLMVFALGIALTWVCFQLASRLLVPRRAVLAAAFFLIFIYGMPLNATHHWFSELMVLGAIIVLMGGCTNTRVAASGVLLGVATFFTQTRGPIAFAAFIAYLAWERNRERLSWRVFWKRTALLSVSSAAAWSILSGYFIATLGVRQLWYWQVIYSARYKVTGANALGLPGGAFEWHRLPAYASMLFVYVMLPVVYCVSTWSCMKDRREPLQVHTSRRMLLTLVGLATALEIALSPNWLRVYCVAAPGVILLVWAIGRIETMKRSFAGLLWLVLICIAARETWARHRAQRAIAQLPAGRVAMVKEAAAKLEWIAQRTRPGDFFFQPAWPGVYLPLHLQSPIYAEAFNLTEETRPEYVLQSIREVAAKQVKYILWAERLDAPSDPEHTQSYHLAPFREYMRANYRMVWVFPDKDQLWERTGN
jgi:hypothetical protein